MVGTWIGRLEAIILNWKFHGPRVGQNLAKEGLARRLGPFLVPLFGWETSFKLSNSYFGPIFRREPRKNLFGTRGFPLFIRANFVGFILPISREELD